MVQSMPPQYQSTDTFGALLRRLRRDRGLTQEQLADRVSCHKTLISHLERDSKYPTNIIVDNLIHALRLSPADQKRLRSTARPAKRTPTHELEHLITTITRDAHYNEISDYILRGDLGRLTTAWDEFVEASSWLRHAHLESARDRFKQLFEKPGLTPSVRLLAGSYLAKAYQRLGQLTEAGGILDRMHAATDLIESLPAVEQILLRADIFAQWGDIALREGKYAEAQVDYEDSYGLYLQVEASLPNTDDRWLAHIGLGQSRLLLAKVAIFQRREEEALRHCDGSEEHWNQVVPPSREGRSSPQQAEGLLRVEEFRAWAHARMSHFELAQSMRNKVRQDAQASRQTELQMKNRLYTGDDLRRRIEERVELQRKLPNFRYVSPGVALNAITGESRDEVQRWIKDAEMAYEEAISLCGGSGGWRDPLIWGLCLRNMAIIKRFQGKFSQAEKLLSQAEQYESKLNQRGRLPSIYETWGDLNWDRGQLDLASKRYQQALATLAELRENVAFGDDWQRFQRERIQQHLDSLASQARLSPTADAQDDDQPTRIWLEWRLVTRKVIRLLDAALWRIGAVPVAIRDMDPNWIRELADFEDLEGSRVLAQDTLSMSLAERLPVSAEVTSVQVHKIRYDVLHSRAATWPFDESRPAAHDVCCRPTIEGSLSDPHQRARALGAAALLEAGGYQLDAGLFPLPLGFAVKRGRVLVELPPQTIKRYNMRVAELLASYTASRQFCFRLDDLPLAEDLCAAFDTLAELARRSTLSTVSMEQHEESTYAWLSGLLKQWNLPTDAMSPITPAI